MNPRRAVFLDRDNTINYDPGYLSDPASVRLLPGAAEGLRMLQAHGLPLVLISNQAGVGRGYFSEAMLHAVHARLVEVLAAEDIRLHAFYYCLHAPSDACFCRKPAPGMLQQAAREHNFNLPCSFMVGDKPSDVEAGRRAGCRTVLIGGMQNEEVNADVLVQDLHAAAVWIVHQLGRPC